MRNNRGFTLVETLASIFILCLVGTVFFQFFIMSQKGTINNEEKLVALNLAKSVMEEIKAKSSYAGTEINQIGTYGKPECEKVETGSIDCKEINQLLNGQDYSIVFVISEKKDVGLYPIKIKVYHRGEDLKTTLEGLVKLDI